MLVTHLDVASQVTTLFCALGPLSTQSIKRMTGDAQRRVVTWDATFVCMTKSIKRMTRDAQRRGREGERERRREGEKERGREGGRERGRGQTRKRARARKHFSERKREIQEKRRKDGVCESHMRSAHTFFLSLLKNNLF